MKHKHCDIIKAWAQGAEIQVFQVGDTFTDSRWRDIADRDLNWQPEVKYRIKPKKEFLKFRNALLKFRDESVLIHTYYPRDYERIEEADYFVKWIGEEQTVNIEWLQ